MVSYTVLIVDMVDSKKLPKEDREQAQKFIKLCLTTLNDIFKPALEFNMIFSAGDEVQGLFKSPIGAFLYFRLLKLILYPIKIRCGIGMGEWAVRIPNGTSSEQDGPAYHNARKAILRAHDKNNCNTLFNSNNADDIFVNTLINASFLFTKKHSNHQSLIFLLTELILPLVHRPDMIIGKFNKVFTLVENKFEQTFNTNAEIKTEKKQEIKNNLHDKIFANFDPFYVFSHSVLDNEFTLTSTLKKGLSTKISSITNTSRQNIDNVMKSANITEIRNIDLTILLFINKIFTR